MNLRVQKRDNPYLQVDKTAINDLDLSPQALGVLVYILAKPNDWKAHKREIIKRFSQSKQCKTTANGMDSIFIELRKAGYIQIVPLRNEKGHVTGSEYVFCEMPIKSTEMPQSSMLGEQTEMPQSSEVGTLPTLGNLGGLKEERLPLVMNEEKENEGAHAKDFSEPTQNEEEKEKEKSCAKKEKIEMPTAPAFNPKAKKVYESHLEIYNDLLMLWKTDEFKKGTLKATLDPLGINDNTPEKKEAFAEMVKDIYCPSIKLAFTFAISPTDIHDKVIQKIGFDKDKIKALIAKPKQVTTEHKKVATIENNEENERIIIAYCKHITGYDFKTAKEYFMYDQKSKRMFMKAKEDIAGVKNYLKEKSIAI